MLSSITAMSRSACRFFSPLAFAAAILATFMVAPSAQAAPQQGSTSIKLLADLNPGTTTLPSLEVNNLIAFDDKLYMAAQPKPWLGMELYEFDPATDTLRLVSDLRPGSGSSFPSEFVVYDDRLFFAAGTGLNGNELHVYDPTDDSVSLVQDMTPALYASTQPSNLLVFDDKLYFVGNTPENTAAVYIYDASTDQVTVGPTPTQMWSKLMVTHVGLIAVLSQAYEVSPGDYAFFEFLDHQDTFVPWRISMIPYELLGSQYLNPNSIAYQNGVLAWLPNLGTSGIAMYDFQLGDLRYLPATNPQHHVSWRRLMVHENFFYWFEHAQASSEYALHSASLSSVSLNAHPGQTFINVDWAQQLSTGVYFAGYQTASGSEPWRFNFANSSYESLGDLMPEVESSSPQWFTELNGTVYVAAELPGTGEELLSLASGETTFSLVKELGEVAKSSFPQSKTIIGRDLYVVAATGSGFGDLSDDQLAGNDQLDGQEQLIVQKQGGKQAPHDNIVDDEEREIYRVNIDSKQATKLTAFSTPGRAASFSQLVGVGNKLFFRVNSANENGLRMYDLGTGTITAPPLPGEFEANLIRPFNSQYALLQAVTYSPSFAFANFLVDAQGTVTAFQELTTGIPLIEVQQVHAFDGGLYVFAMDRDTARQTFYRIDDTTLEVTAPFDSRDFGLSSATESFYGVISAVLGDYLVLNVFVGSDFKQFVYDKTLGVREVVGAPSAFDAVLLGDKIISVGFNNRIGIFDTVTGSFEEVTHQAAEGDQTYFYEDIFVFEGKAVFKGNNQTDGAGELYTIDLTDNTISLFMSTMDGAASSDMYEFLPFEGQVFMTAFSDTYGQELFTLSSNSPPTIGGTPATTVAEGQAYSFTPTASDADNDPFSFSIENKPSWASFNTETGALTGTPGFTDAALYSNIMITVADATGSSSLGPFSITVTNTNRPPVMSGTPPTEVDEGQLYTFTPTVSDPDVDDELTFDVFNLPEWASFNYNTGTLSGTPNFDQAANYSEISITVSDGTAQDQIGPFMISVRNVNRAPTISGTPQLEVDEGQLYAFQVTAFDPDNNHLVFEISGNPDWMQIDADTGAVTGMPDFTSAGVYENIEVSVTDGPARAALLPFTVTVNNVNRAPTIGGTPDFEVNEGQAYSFVPTASDADAEDILTFSISGKPSWASFNTATGALTGTPSFTDADVYPNISISVTDGTDTTPMAPFSITVNNVNRAPVITNTPLLTVKDGEAYSFVPVVSDPDIEVDDTESLSFGIDNKPTWAEFDTDTGALTGTPSNEDIAEWAGITITVTDRDGLSDSVGPFIITVTASNSPPVAVDDVFSFASYAGIAEAIDVLRNDSDPDAGDQIRVVGAKLLTGNPDIYVVGDGSDVFFSIPSALGKLTGELKIEYTIRDRAGEESSAIVTVTLFDPNAPIVLIPPADITVNATGQVTTVSNIGEATAKGPDGKSLAVSPSGLRKGYTSGEHIITWSAGTGTQKVTATQKVTVIPQVSLTEDFEAKANQSFEVPVKLSGPAPSYPYSVQLQVTNGHDSDTVTVVFAKGALASSWTHDDGFNGTAISFVLAGSENIGAVRSITVKAAQEPEPRQMAARTSNPTPTPGQQVPMLVDPEKLGDITGAVLSAVLVPASGDSDIPLTTPTFDSEGTFAVTVPSTTPPGVYLIAVVINKAGAQSRAIIVPIVVRRSVAAAAEDSLMGFEYDPDDEDLSRELDQNENGFVDYEDGRWDYNANGIPAYLDRALTESHIWADGAMLQARPGSWMMAYPDENDARSVRVATTPDAQLQELQSTTPGAFTQAGLDISDYRFFGEFYRFKVNVLATWGADAEVSLPLDEPIGAGSEFLLWQAGAWRTFAEGAGGSLASAGSVYGVCPSIESAAWQPGLNEGHWCVRLVIADGGVNDTDGQENASVDVFGGVAINDAGNNVPVAVADTATAVWRGSVAIPLLANDTDADNDALSIISATVDIGTVTINAARTGVQYVSAGDFAGTATITYVVSDNNGGVAVGTATVTVLENRAPVVGADSTVTVAGRPVTVNVLGNDADPDGDNISVISASVAASAGSVSYTASSVTFAPAAGFTGVATVSYTVSDGRGGETVGTLNVQVNAAVEVIEVRPATGAFSWWLLAFGGLLLAGRRRR